MSKRLSNYFTLDDISKMIGLDKHHMYEAYDDRFVENCDNNCECSEELQNKGKCECGYEQERTDIFNRYQSAVLDIAEKLLKEHGLKLEETKKVWRWKLVPIISWRNAATHIMTTIEGYGMFDFNGRTKDFLASGPYTPYSATIEHLHWMKEWYQVYGDYDAKYQLERKMRT